MLLVWGGVGNRYQHAWHIVGAGTITSGSVLYPPSFVIGTPSAIYLAGTYAPSLALTGSVGTSVTGAGVYATSISLKGSAG